MLSMLLRLLWISSKRNIAQINDSYRKKSCLRKHNGIKAFWTPYIYVMVHPNKSLLYFTFRLLASKKENCYVDVLHVAILEKQHLQNTWLYKSGCNVFVVGVKLFFGRFGFCFTCLNYDMLLMILAMISKYIEA